MIWFLVATGLAYTGLGEWTEGLTLLVSIVPLIGMDAFLHRRTQASTEALGQTLAPTSSVLRDGGWKVVPSLELVPGDRVRITAGEGLPADVVFVSTENVQTDESSLTGESLPVGKRAYEDGSEPPDVEGEGVVYVDGLHWGFAGTRMLTGHGEALVVHTGRATWYGDIVRSSRAGHERTPLQAAIGQLVSLLLVFAGVLCVMLAAIRFRQGHGVVDALVSAATLAVAALPEEFPVVFTVFLGVGVYRLAKRKALVRRAVSVENIGRITCIASDKTGTMTMGLLRLEHLVPAPGLTESELLGIASLASRDESGDPLDLAILSRSAGLVPPQTSPRVLEVHPYTERRRRETAIVEDEQGVLAVTKGSPETILAACSIAAAERDAWLAEVDRLAAGGHKVLACASWRLHGPWVGGEPDRDGSFAGLLACEDPVRDGVADAVAECRAAGMRIVMITGDHPATAESVARALGIGGSSPRVILGEDAEAGASLTDVDVVARALPSHKLSIVRALRAAGELVAVTGDGVNDVPALQAADVGIAMGNRGTRSAREAASIVLLDDDFTTVVRAVAEGRQLFRNLQASFQYLLSIHIPLVLTATFIPFTGHPVLYLPIHVVWLEAIIHPTAMLVFQGLPSPGRLPPRRGRRTTGFFSPREWILLGVVGGTITLAILRGYERSLAPQGHVEHARAMAMLLLSASSSFLSGILGRFRTRSALVMTVLPILLVAVLVQPASVARLLHLQPLHAADWARGLSAAGAATLLPFALLDALPAWWRRRRPRARRP